MRVAIESTHEYRGLYHVLHGTLNPLEGTGPEALHIDDLQKRLPCQVKEIILATSSSVEGEATALYLKKRLAPFGLRVSRIASGIPVGGELEYVDRGTLGRALAGRRDILTVGAGFKPAPTYPQAPDFSSMTAFLALCVIPIGSFCRTCGRCFVFDRRIDQALKLIERFAIFGHTKGFAGKL